MSEEKKDSFGRPIPAQVKPLSTRDLYLVCPKCNEKIILWSPAKEEKK